MKASAVIAGATLMVATLLVATPAQAAPPTTTKGPCGYTSTPDDPPARNVTLPPDPKHTPDKGIVKVVVATNQGPMLLSLDRAKAPCTVQSFLHLAKSRFYDFTTCHRLTLYTTLKVLQCGDPSGTGEGGPGYSYKDELASAVALPNWPGDTTGTRKLYGRGVLAMANAGPDTNGSQFFLVFADSRLRPDYTVFGTVDRTGLKTLDKVAAAGTVVSADNPDNLDGPPVRKTDILIARSLGNW
ncbi:peptidylprolyl isomerase [Kribbella antibiotica]|uniref:Peptidyl-prolyl cis-trans isomerase n=1 Tax=Kribbella antibiotica TaxID=190195 RepID=A0A4V6PE51_9ACTN|nr:peptidylprolyl isomerase [Kribbella antibiotica]TDD57107.1 peptidylprolyl isomerase [Kribbella antibiotica]